MKQSNILVPALLVIVMVGCTERKDVESEASESQEEAKSRVEDLYPIEIVPAYMVLKDALIATDFEAAKSATIEYKRAVIGNLDVGFEKALSAVSDKIIQAQSIEEQRVQFEQISILMYALAGNGEFEDYRLYKQFCPMAFDDKGAYWLSLDEEILNPYFGDLMLKCGYVEEVL